MTPTVAIHMVCSLLSYAAFLIACVTAVLYLAQERQLKHKTMGVLFHRLPSLDALERGNVVALSLGFALLTIGTICGFLGSGVLLGRWWTGDPKEVLTVLLWLSYCTLWLLRMRATLRGHRIALLSIFGFTLVLFTAIATSSWHVSMHPFTRYSSK